MPPPSPVRKRLRFTVSTDLSRGLISEGLVPENSNPSPIQTAKNCCLHIEEYSVGWICALSIERAAATVMLDEEHSGLPICDRSKNDSNVYTLGRIGNHNVVIACLPAGQMGTISATTVAAQMMSTFSAIQFLFMVGIGGGVPSVEADIRLGDVVISEPRMGRGGVIQYDFGKALMDGELVPTGFLNAPPLPLLNALAKFKSDRFTGKCNIITQLEKFARLPGFSLDLDKMEPDILFNANFNHLEGSKCESCKQSGNIVERAPRAYGEDIQVHYGTIASGNWVIKDAATRDKLSSQFGGFLCYEMEAAGLMNNYPALIIRGISDYADSHKNKSWQPYAAATAAVCAKEILHQLPPVGNEMKEDSSWWTRAKNIAEPLPYVEEAAFDSYEMRHKALCLYGTRVEVLDQIRIWIEGEDHQWIFWLNGMAGTGKSTIARTIAGEYKQREKLGGSYFFVRGGKTGSAKRFFATIAADLARASQALQNSISQSFDKNPEVVDKNLKEQWENLILQPLLKADAEYGSPPRPRPLLLVIDALDECDGDKDVQAIIGLLSDPRIKDMKAMRLRVLVTSRPDTPIRLGFRNKKEIFHRSLVLDAINRQIVDRDIGLFFKTQFQEIRDNSIVGDLPSDWPGDDRISLLVSQAEGLFIYAATVCNFVSTEDWPPEDLLRAFLPSNAGEPQQLYVGPRRDISELDTMYTTILDLAVKRSRNNNNKDRLLDGYRSIIGPLAALFEPLSYKAFSSLLSMSSAMVRLRLEHLRSVFHVPDEDDYAIRIIHTSFRDFLLDEQRCPELLWVDVAQIHGRIGNGCLELMSKHLKKDMCGLQQVGVLIEDIEDELVSQHISWEIEYACRFWIQHLCKSSIQHEDYGLVHVFLQKHLLHWLETLSLLGRISEGVQGIVCLEQTISAIQSPNLHAFVHDARRFTLYNRSIMTKAPLQIYCSALIFAPERSLVKEQYSAEIPRSICRKSKIRRDWGPVIQVIDGHYGEIAIAFSPDGRLLAASNEEKRAIILYDPTTGEPLIEIFDAVEKLTAWVGCVAFSPCGKFLASASNDGIVMLWDSASGKAVHSLKGHTGRISFIAFSPDSVLLASASWDRTVRLWNLATGEIVCTFNGHSHRVFHVAFSPDGKLVASRSSDSVEITVLFWDPANGNIVHILNGNSAADGMHLAFTLRDHAVRLWNGTAGEIFCNLTGCIGPDTHVAFSPDGKLVASTGYRQCKAIHVLYTATKKDVLALGNTSFAPAVFSPNGAFLAFTNSNDCFLLELATKNIVQTFRGHNGFISRVLFSPDGKRLVSASGTDGTITLWDTAYYISEETIRTQDGRNGIGRVRHIVFSPDGKLLAVALDDDTVMLWDVATCETVHTTFDAHGGPLHQIAFSPDGVHLVVVTGIFDDNTRKFNFKFELWNYRTGRRKPLFMFDGTLDSYCPLVFSPNGKLMAFSTLRSLTGMNTSKVGGIMLLDVTSGNLKAVDIDHDNSNLCWYNFSIFYNAFSSDGKLLASAWSEGYNKPARIAILDLKNGNYSDGKSRVLCELRTPELDTESWHIFKLCFSEDCKQLRFESEVGWRQFSINIEEPFWISTIPEDRSLWIGDSAHWVYIGEQRVLWLPEEYRPPAADIDDIGSLGNCRATKVATDTHLAIICRSGDLLFLQITGSSPA